MNDESPVNEIDTKKRPGRSGMSDVLTILVVVAAWLLLTQVVLPKLGVPT